ncbi:MAG TPA: hypothetical protein VKZ54_10205 [Membranihabitans sp.]|nr:hypothetical protein [Membranihabitans sp.]
MLYRIGVLFFAVAVFYSCTPKVAETVSNPVAEQDTVAAYVGPCGTFKDSPLGDDAITAHVLYRDLFKKERYEQAFPFWKKAFRIAPAADGKRNTHFADGITFYQHFYDNTTDTVLQQKYVDTIFQLYDQMEECYGGSGYVLGRKAFDLYFKYPELANEDEIYNLFKQSMDMDQDSAHFFILNPFTDLLVRRYFNLKIGESEAQKYAAMITNRLQKGLESGENEAQWAIINDYVPARLSAFEGVRGFFDCDYYLNKYVPQYEADPENCEVITSVYRSLIWGGCSDTGNEDFERIKAVYDESCSVVETVATSSKSREGFNSLEAGDFEKAIDLFNQAAEETDDVERKAQLYLLIAKIYYGSLKRFPISRQFARKASEVKPNWGEPYLLVGKLYASSGPLCGPGTGWDSQVVVWPAIDEWQKARSVDPASASEANSLINRYTQYMPSKGDIFQRTLNEGDSFTVGCWIQQQTTIRAAN